MKKVILILTSVIIGNLTFAQVADNTTMSDRPVLTGAPFLRISPDARAGGLGDMGVATSPDAFSQYWNPAKYVFSKSYSGVGISYTPYLSEITNDVFLLNGSFYTYLGEDERSTLGASIYYFKLGEVDLTKLVAGNIVSLGKANPNEFSIDFSYGLKLTDNYSMAVAARYIRSDLFNNDQDATTKAGNSFAVDVSAYGQTSRMNISDFEGRLRYGLNISNIGPKISYSDVEESTNFLPTNLRIGSAFDFILDDYNTVTLGLEASKLLVPTPSVPIESNNVIVRYAIPNKGVVSSIFGSFNDAPGGFAEEMKEVIWSVSGEYVYNNAFSFRGGYFHESMEKGARQYATLGAGLKFNAFGLDLSYLIPTNNENNALANTLRFALTWDFGGETYNSFDN